MMGGVVPEVCEDWGSCKDTEVAMKGSVSSVSIFSMFGELDVALPI